jgi:hypothetical protein
MVHRDATFKKKVLFTYYIIGTLLILYASLLAFYKTMGDNNWLYNLFFLLTICIASYYFFQILQNKIKKYVIAILFVVNVSLFIRYDILAHQFFNTYNNYVNAFCFLSIVVYALLYFDQLLRNVSEQNILNDFDFWLISGYLLYFLGGFFLILMYKDANVEQRGIIWAIQNTILLCSSLVTLTGTLWIQRRRNSG